jgi:hypothetical protein
MIPDKVDNIPICKPIKFFLELVESHGGSIIEQKISDYHFHELFFKVNNFQNKDVKNIEGIEMLRDGIYYCTCHWSTVEISHLRSPEC